MREVIIRRFCANCYRHGKRTELVSGQGEYKIVVNEFGAKTDLCDDCAQAVLVPLLEMMSAGEDLSALNRLDWAQLGSVFPRAAAIRKLNGPASIKPGASEPAVSEPVAAWLVPGNAGAGNPEDAGHRGNPAKATSRRQTASRRKGMSGRKAVPDRSKTAAHTAHVCPGCGQTFTRAANLAIHVNNFGAQPHQRPTRRGAAVIGDTAHRDPAQQNAVQAAASAPTQRTPTPSVDGDNGDPPAETTTSDSGGVGDGGTAS